MYVAVCCSVLQSLAVPVTCQHVNTLVPAISLSNTRQTILIDIPIALSTDISSIIMQMTIYPLSARTISILFDSTLYITMTIAISRYPFQ